MCHRLLSRRDRRLAGFHPTPSPQGTGVFKAKPDTRSLGKWEFCPIRSSARFRALASGGCLYRHRSTTLFQGTCCGDQANSRPTPDIPDTSVLVLQQKLGNEIIGAPAIRTPHVVRACAAWRKALGAEIALTVQFPNNSRSGGYPTPPREDEALDGICRPVARSQASLECTQAATAATYNESPPRMTRRRFVSEMSKSDKALFSAGQIRVLIRTWTWRSCSRSGSPNAPIWIL